MVLLIKNWVWVSESAEGSNSSPVVLIYRKGSHSNPLIGGGGVPPNSHLPPDLWGGCQTTPGILLLKESLFELFSLCFLIFFIWVGGLSPW